MNGDDNPGIGEIRLTWRKIASMLHLPDGYEIVGAEVRYPETVDVLVSGPGLPHVDCGSPIPRLVPRATMSFDVYVEDDLKHRQE
jgi:hypothetical protein